MIAPYKIRWQQQSSLEMECWVELAFEGDDGPTESHLNRSAIVAETYNGVFKRVSGYKWDSGFNFTITFVKQDYSDFTDLENRKMLKWLTGSSYPALIDVYKYDPDTDDPEVIEWSALGNFINVSQYKLGNGRIVGYVAEWESVMPYALSELITKTYPEPGVGGNKIKIDVDTDDNQPICPRITIQQTGTIVNVPADRVYSEASTSDMVENTAYYNSATGTYYWKSDERVSSATNPNYGWDEVEVDKAYSTTDVLERETIYYYKQNNMYYWIEPYRFHSSGSKPNLGVTSVALTNTHIDIFSQPKVLDPMIVKNNTGTEKIVVDGANKVIYSVTNDKRIFDQDFDGWHWLELYDGTNEIMVDGTCTITFEYREIRKVGEYV